VCGVLGFLAEGADGKPRRADLKVSAASLSGQPVAGARVTVRATVRNAGKAKARASRLSVGLKGMRAPLARAKVSKLKPRKKKTVSLSVPLPRVIAPGRYAIVVCADAARKVKLAWGRRRARR
jgi:hypothetical protein